MVTNTSTVTFYPTLRYADPDAAMEWLERSLGFERREDHRDGAGNLVHAELSLGSSIVMLSGAGGGREPFSSLPAGGTLVYCGVDQVEALHAQARAAGADIAVELTDTDYGSRDFTARDPEGNLWSFGTCRT